jgi:hypothetical protein
VVPGLCSTMKKRGLSYSAAMPRTARSAVRKRFANKSTKDSQTTARSAVRKRFENDSQTTARSAVRKRFENDSQRTARSAVRKRFENDSQTTARSAVLKRFENDSQTTARSAVRKRFENNAQGLQTKKHGAGINTIFINNITDSNCSSVRFFRKRRSRIYGDER